MEEDNREEQDLLAALKMEKQLVLNQQVVEQQLQSPCAEVVTEVGTSTFTEETVRKFVKNQSGSADECSIMNPAKQFVRNQ